MEEVYILIADIRGHTQWAEEHTANQLASLLKKYYSIPFGKYLHANLSSDEIAIFYEKAEDALKAALEIRDFGQGVLSNEDLSLGVALHKGEVKKLQFTDNDIQYNTYVGHPICLCKRLESISYGGDIIISDKVFADLTEDQQDIFDIDKEVQVKGVKDKVQVYISVS